MVGTLTDNRGVEDVVSLDGAEEMDYEVQLLSSANTPIVTYILGKSVSHGKNDATTSWAPLWQAG